MFNPVYARKVAFLLRLMPYVTNEGVFAVHGGTAINLFVKDMLRYSVDIDLTYMPLAGRESLAPALIDQREAMANQFEGMTDVAFSYEEFEQTRLQLIRDVKAMLTEEDKRFLVSFEQGKPLWDGYEFAYFKDYPSVQWKLVNLAKLKRQNPEKMEEEVEKLRRCW